MKKIVFFVASMVICFFLTSCGRTAEYPYYDMKIVSEGGQAMYAIMPKTLAEVRDHCGAIVQGKVESGGETINLTEGEHPIKSTLSKLTVTKVYKGNIIEGDTIQLCEGYYIVEDEGGDHKLVLKKNYMPSDSNVEYIFFLVHGSEGAKFAEIYSPLVHEMGRYPVINTNAHTALDVNTMPVENLYIRTNDQIYRDIYQEVINEYMK